MEESKIKKYPSFIHENLEDRIIDALDAKEEISSYLFLLKERDRQIIELLYGVNGKPLLTASEIAQIFHITESRVNQIRKESFRKTKKESVKTFFFSSML